MTLEAFAESPDATLYASKDVRDENGKTDGDQGLMDLAS